MAGVMLLLGWIKAPVRADAAVWNEKFQLEFLDYAAINENSQQSSLYPTRIPSVLPALDSRQCCSNVRAEILDLTAVPRRDFAFQATVSRFSGNAFLADSVENHCLTPSSSTTPVDGDGQVYTAQRCDNQSISGARSLVGRGVARRAAWTKRSSASRKEARCRGVRADGPPVSTPVARKCCPRARPANAPPMLSAVHSRPSNAKARAPRAKQRAASGMSAVAQRSAAPILSAIQSSATSGPVGTSTISTFERPGARIGREPFETT